MSACPQSDDEALLAIVDQHRHPTGLINSTSLAAALDKPRTSVQYALARLGLIESAQPVDAPPELTPVEVRNERFWKKRSADLESELAETKHLLEQVAGLMERAPSPPKWALPSTNDKPGRSVGLLHISDLHGGEIVRPQEILGLNKYDIAIARKRFRQYITAACEILPRWSVDTHFEGVVCAFNGDQTSGDIHEELRMTNEIASLEQVEFATDEFCAGLEILAGKFHKVDAYFTCGNHGRQTLKTHAKGTISLNFDTMIGKQVARYFTKDDRVTVHVAPGRDCEYRIFGHRVLQTHGDQGGGGGQGFAGPVLPIARKAKALEFLSAQTRDFHDVILTAHHHFSTHPTRKLYGNGSIVGYNEFSRSIRAAPESPMQWLLLVTERWGIREAAEIVLDRLGGWK